MKELERFGDHIRTLRKRANWSQQELGDKADGTGLSVVSRAERTHEPSLEVARTLVRALDDANRLSAREHRELAMSYLYTPEMRQRLPEGSPVVGLSFTTTQYGSYWAQMVAALERELAAMGYRLVLCQHNNSISRELDDLQFFENLDPLVGVISSPAAGIRRHTQSQLDRLDAVIEKLARRQIPMVFLGRRVNVRHPIPLVAADDRKGAVMAVDRLSDHGHRRIAALIDLPHNSAQELRLEGYRAAMQAHGSKYRQEVLGEDVVETERAAFYAQHGFRRSLSNAIKLLELPEKERPTAIFASTASLASAVREAVKIVNERHGRDVTIPDSLSLIGFDDSPLLDVSPRITRVFCPVEKVAHPAVRKLSLLIEGIRTEDVLGDMIIPDFEFGPGPKGAENVSVRQVDPIEYESEPASDITVRNVRTA